MDELEISGRRYISTRRAAREHSYHSDYMGQLIRAGKVAGQKVGRSWYIDEVSLIAYLGKAPAGLVAAAGPRALSQTEAETISAPAPEVNEIKEEEPPVALEPTLMPQGIKITEPQPIQKEKPAAIFGEAPEPAIPAPMPQVVEEKSTRIPIHTPIAPAYQQGGLRYEPEDSVALPRIVRMPQRAAILAPEHFREPIPAPFPVVSLSIVAVAVAIAAAFASNFITADIVSEPGKPAVVQYAIHW